METKKTCSNELRILDERYKLIEGIYSGPFSEVYIVQDLKDNNKEYALKLFKKNNYFENEVKINKMIAETKNSSFIKYITSSVGYLITDEEKTLKSYIIFELAKKGDVISYIQCKKTCLSERSCKIIFAKIIEIIKLLHKLGICHKDLKLDNFLFDENFEIKLCDFGISKIIPKDKNGKSLLINGNGNGIGTTQYIAPEIFEKKKYDGEKIDIFSLGVILFNLRLQKFAFRHAYIPKSKTKTKSKMELKDKMYKYIKEKKYHKMFWKILELNFNIKGISEEFKNLYLRMVAYDPKERPTIEEIYNDKWMKEIRDLNEKELENCQKELIKELKIREILMKFKNNNTFRRSYSCP